MTKKGSNRNFDKKRKIINEYNSSSFYYDKRYYQIQKEKFKIILKKPNFESKRILDAGCGTGLLLEHMLSLFNQNDKINYSYVGIDISFNMLHEFYFKIKNLNNKRDINLVLSDIEYLPFRENFFNLIYSITSFQNLSNIKLGFENLLRVSASRAKLNLSILKKKFDLEEFLTFIKPSLQDLEIIAKGEIEDIIIQGKIIKH